MIELKNVDKTFGDRVLFRNLNITIEDGEFVCFSGPSGCGKSTLLNMIGGLEGINAGEILINGKNIAKRKDRFSCFRDDLGFIFQNFALVETKTVQENLNLIAPKSRNDISVEEALEFVGLSDSADKKIYMLSGGEQQRIAIARLMIKKCNIVLADEPTGSLDRANVENIIMLLKKLHEMGKTVVLVTHSDEVRSAADRIISIPDF